MIVQSPAGASIVNSYRHRFAREKPSPRSSTHLQQTPEHAMVITGKRNTNGKVLVVRCTCMAEYRRVKTTYYNYDPLGEVTSLQAAKELYSQHLLDSV